MSQPVHDRQDAPFAPSEAERLVTRSTGVDVERLEAQAASLVTRSISPDARRSGLDLMIRCMDLTTLDDRDTPDRITALCAEAVRPDPSRADIPPVAAVCLLPRFVPLAVAALADTSVAVASVAGGFPSGLGPLDARLHEIDEVVAMGADEVDIVLNRALVLEGRYREAFDELVAARGTVAPPARLKVILETGELGSYDRVRQASMVAMAAGADYIKTSTGKVGVGATPPAVLCMLEAAHDFRAWTGRTVGLKVAGGVRTAEQALGYLELVRETFGAGWARPERFRVGASSLLEDLVSELDVLERDAPQVDGSESQARKIDR